MFAAVDDFVVGGAFVETLEDGAGGRRHVADGVVFADEGYDRVEAVEPHERLKLDLVADLAAHQVNASKTGDLPRLDAGDHLIILGEVTDGAPPAPGTKPLMYFRRSYGTWED